jgi:catechol 2,3-dioxygenase-like lactoylglutathione lyase family enzyme
LVSLPTGTPDEWKGRISVKRVIFVLVSISALLFSPAAQAGAAEDQTGPFGQGTVVQIGVVVKDIEKAAAAYADLLGVSVPKWSWTDAQDQAHTQFKGKPSPARAKLAFIELKNITLELIEPDRNPSTWREFLETKGEGVHHIAFEIKGMDDKTALLERKGMPLLQKGDYEGGRYAYIDGTAGLGLILELLENF